MDDLEEFKQKWNTLESQLKEIRDKLTPLKEQEFKIDRQLRDLHSYGLFKGYEYQYGEWILKEDVRKNPLLDIPYKELRLLVPSFRKEIFVFLFGDGEDSSLEGLNLVIIDHLKKYKLAKVDGNEKEAGILLEQLMEVVSPSLEG